MNVVVLLAFMALASVSAMAAELTNDQPISGQQRISDFLNKTRKTDSAQYVTENPWPGAFIDFTDKEVSKLFYQNWPYRSICFEIFYGESRRLAHAVYDLAIYVGDVKPDMPLDKFEAGVKGFRYDASQVVDWANSVKRAGKSFNTPEETELLNLLVSNGVLLFSGEQYKPVGKIIHIIGASQGAKRPLSLNLNHERLHVVWSMDEGLRNQFTEKWKLMDSEQRKQALDKLKIYNEEDENKLINEWAVRQLESTDWLSQYKTMN